MIKIYGSPTCSWCDKAKNIVEQYNLKYTYINALENSEEFEQSFPGAKTVPQITWDNRYIGGYEELVTEIENTIGGYGDGKI